MKYPPVREISSYTGIAVFCPKRRAHVSFEWFLSLIFKIRKEYIDFFFKSSGKYDSAERKIKEII